jgi:HlyD family secretion protein
MKKLFLIIFILFLTCNKNKREIFSGVFTGEEYILRPVVSGKIASFPYNEGHLVTKNDTIIVIDDSELKKIITSLGYNVQNLRLELKNADEDMKKAEELYKASAISEEKYELAERRYKSLQLQLKSAEASLEAKRESVKHFHIIAPVNGYISKKYLKEGETAIPGTPIVEILDLNIIYLNIYVPEVILPKISINQKVDVKVDAFPDRTFNGKVVYISKEAEFTPKNIQTREDRILLVYRVKVLIENPEGLIKPGIYGDAILK